MKELLYLKDDQLKALIEKLFVSYRETFSDSKKILGMTSEEIEWRINEVLNEIPEAVGMNNHQGSRATADGKIMSVVASVLKNRDKYLVKSNDMYCNFFNHLLVTIGH